MRISLKLNPQTIFLRGQKVNLIRGSKVWLGGRDSNPDSQIQSLESYHWTTSQQGDLNLRIGATVVNQASKKLMLELGALKMHNGPAVSSCSGTHL